MRRGSWLSERESAASERFMIGHLTLIICHLDGKLQFHRKRRRAFANSSLGVSAKWQTINVK